MMSDEKHKATSSRRSCVELSEGDLDLVVGGNSDPDDPDPKAAR